MCAVAAVAARGRSPGGAAVAVVARGCPGFKKGGGGGQQPRHFPQKLNSSGMPEPCGCCVCAPAAAN